MRLSIIGYNTFKDVVAELGGLGSVFYCQSGGTVFKIVAFVAGGVYVSADLTTGGVAPATFLTDFPGSVECPFNVSGDY